ncbi:MAG: hypothetical protein HOJ34_02780 [Kordiimonadaceae bacterium]|nr:hypothetical protein [Kordiimonadaceae bacterium]
MIIIVIAIFFTLGVIVNSYKHIDQGEVSRSVLMKALIPAAIAVICLSLRVSYFALPEEAMVSTEYLNYRKALLGVFLALMGYILRSAIYGSVYIYRKKA